MLSDQTIKPRGSTGLKFLQHIVYKIVLDCKLQSALLICRLTMCFYRTSQSYLKSQNLVNWSLSKSLRFCHSIKSQMQSQYILKLWISALLYGTVQLLSISASKVNVIMQETSETDLGRCTNSVLYNQSSFGKEQASGRIADGIDYSPKNAICKQHWHSSWASLLTELGHLVVGTRAISFHSISVQSPAAVWN